MRSFDKMDCQPRNVKHTMRGLLLVLLVNYFSCVSGTLLLSGLQIPLQEPLAESDRGHIRLGRICENSFECRSGCCLFNSTAGFFTCQRENQRYSNCSPRRPKALWGTFLDVYLHHCPCKPHLRCVKEHSWHVCLQRKRPSGTPKPPGQKPIDEEKPPGGQKPTPPPGWHPGIGTYNGTLGLGEVCGTSIDCKSECCVYNPRVGLAYCHRLEQIYDDCSPWHPKEEKGTLVDIYFRHCPCNGKLRCRKEKKWHVCRKREPEFGAGRPSQQKPVQKPQVPRPEMEAQRPLQQQPAEVTAVGEPETHQPKPEFKPQQPSQLPMQQQQIQTPQSDIRKPLGQRPVQVPAMPKPERDDEKPDNKTQKPLQEEPSQQQQIHTPPSNAQKPLRRRPVQRPAVRDSEEDEDKPENKTRKPLPQKPVQQQRILTPQGNTQKPLRRRPTQKPAVQEPEEGKEKPGNKTRKPLTQEPVQQLLIQTPHGGAQKPLRQRPVQVPVVGKHEDDGEKPSKQEPVKPSQIKTPNSEEQKPLLRQPSQTTQSGEAETHVERKQPPRKKPSRKGRKRKRGKSSRKKGNKAPCNCTLKADNQED